jgi:threonine/homoserine/homoserine lactone efflux protein
MLIVALLGFLAGGLASVPIAGPISALVLARGLEGRFRAGLFIAMGAGLVEALYAFLAFWGFSTFLAQYPIIEPISQAGGAFVLLVLGVVFIRKGKERQKATAPARDSAWGSFALGAWICGINPTLIATWSAFVTMVHGSGIVDLTDSRMALPFAAGCALGICSWFVTLLAIIRRYHGRFRTETLVRVVRTIGVVLLVLSTWFAYRFVSYFLEPQPSALAERSPLCAARATPRG